MQPILDDYNDRPTSGSNMKRSSINKYNVRELLAQLYKAEDYTPLFNTSVLGNFSDRMRKQIGFRFARGQRVLVSLSANYRIKSSLFTKRSVVGSYGKRVYVVKDVFLKSNSKHTYSLCYRLFGLSGLFYQTELLPAVFSEGDDKELELDEDAEDRAIERKRAKRRREGR